MVHGVLSQRLISDGAQLQALVEGRSTAGASGQEGRGLSLGDV